MAQDLKLISIKPNIPDIHNAVIFCIVKKNNVIYKSHNSHATT